MTTTATTQATCSACNATVHIARSHATGRRLVVEDPGNLDRSHRCTRGAPVAVATVDGDTATVAPLNGESRSIGHILNGRLTGPAANVGNVVRKLRGYGHVVLVVGDDA